MRKGNFRFAVIAIGLAVILAMPAGPLAEFAAAQSAQQVGPPASTQVPQPADNNVNWPGAGYGAGALVCNLLYIPAKLVYALLGGIVGGGTFLITAGNQQAANTVWRSALGGDYVVTPQMLAGQQPINFSGPTDTPPDVPAPVTSSSSSTTTTASSGVAPITPLPASGTSTSGSSSTSGVQPLDHGTGPASGSASATGSASSGNIE
jgi:hypothetical protein